MTLIKNGVLHIEAEEKKVCENCGVEAETRPYGKNGAEICYKCGMKNIKETNVLMLKIFDSVTVVHHAETGEVIIFNKQ